MNGLLPIIRRVRRPLLPVEPEKPAQVVATPPPEGSEKKGEGVKDEDRVPDDRD